MFRIYNLKELKRLRKVLEAFDNTTVNFPLDIFRNEERISAFAFGENDKEIYAHTPGEIAISGIEEAENLRELARKKEEEFYTAYRYSMPSPVKKS